MTPEQQAAMRHALEWLNRNSWPDFDKWAQEGKEVRNALRQALADKPLERLAETELKMGIDYTLTQTNVGISDEQLMEMPKREWTGLSEEEIEKFKHLIDWTASWSYGRFAYEIEQALKEKNS